MLLQKRSKANGVVRKRTLGGGFAGWWRLGVAWFFLGPVHTAHGASDYLWAEILWACPAPAVLRPNNHFLFCHYSTSERVGTCLHASLLYRWLARFGFANTLFFNPSYFEVWAKPAA
jgi:hypothetical protein